MKQILKFFPILLLSTPLVVLAQTPGPSCGGGLGGVLCRVNELLGAVLPFLVALGVIYFVWTVVQYFIVDSDEAKTKGRDKIISGLVGLAVIVSVWGLVYIVVDTFGIGQNSAPDVSGLITTSSAAGAACRMGDKLQGVLDYATCVMSKSVVPFIFALAVVFFAWGAVKFFIINAGEEEKRAQGRQFMLWSIIALAAMISIWGLVNILGETFGLTTVLPQVQTTK